MNTLYRWVKEKKITPMKGIGRTKRFIYDDVLEELKQGPDPPRMKK